MNGRMSDTGDDDRGRVGRDRTERQKGDMTDMRLLAISLKGLSRQLGSFRTSLPQLRYWLSYTKI